MKSHDRGKNVNLRERHRFDSGELGERLIEASNVLGMMIVLLLFLQKQNLANAIYLFGLGTLLSGLGLKHMQIRSHHDLAGTQTPLSALVVS